jgi:protein required for attachment to host cells
VRRTAATIFASHGTDQPLQVVREIEHPEGRLKTGDIEADRPGRAFDRAGQGRHAMSPEESPTEHVDQRFVATLAHDLEHARHVGEFSHVILVAAPKLLGKLRAELSENTRKVVLHELAKDLVDPKIWNLREYLAGVARI